MTYLRYFLMILVLLVVCPKSRVEAQTYIPLQLSRTNLTLANVNPTNWWASNVVFFGTNLFAYVSNNILYVGITNVGSGGGGGGSATNALVYNFNPSQFGITSVTNVSITNGAPFTNVVLWGIITSTNLSSISNILYSWSGTVGTGASNLIAATRVILTTDQFAVQNGTNWFIKPGAMLSNINSYASITVYGSDGQTGIQLAPLNNKDWAIYSIVNDRYIFSYTNSNDIIHIQSARTIFGTNVTNGLTVIGPAGGVGVGLTNPPGAGNIAATNNITASNQVIGVHKAVNATANRLALIDTSNLLTNSPVTAAEAAFLGGVTAAIQTQILGLTNRILAVENGHIVTSNDVVNLKNLQQSMQAGAGMTFTTNNTTNVVISMSATNTPIQTKTNFVLNQVYTNQSGTIQLLNSTVFMVTALVNGEASVALYADLGGGVTFSNLIARVGIATTISGGLALPITNNIFGAVSNNVRYYFTNESAGAGNSAGLVDGTGTITTLGSGASGSVGNGTGIQTNFGSGLSNSFVEVTFSNEIHNGYFQYPTYAATTNISWDVMSRSLTLNSNTTITFTLTNLATDLKLQVNNTASSNITITLPPSVVILSWQTNGPVLVNSLSTNFWYFQRDTNNVIYLTIDGPQAAATATGGGITFDSIRTGSYIIFDEFTEPTGSGSASWGPFHFVRNNTGAGSAISDTAGATNAPGIARLNPGTTTTGYITFENYTSAGSAPYLVRGNWTNEFRFRLNSLQTNGTDTFKFIAGFGNQINGTDPTEGAYVRYDSNDTHFVFITANSAGSFKTTNATTLTPVVNTWYKGRVVLAITASVTNVIFTIDDAQTVTYTASNSIPSSTVIGLQHSILKLSGTFQTTADFDYVALAPFMPVSR